jgi:uncharacterized membrane protein YkoI
MARQFAHITPKGGIMKQSKIAVATLVAALGLTPALLLANDTTKAAPTDQTTMQKEAKISMEKAKEIALKKAPGTVESGELEREHGKLIYSFDIRNGKGSITEVNVSAINGKIVAVQHENAAKEAAEKKQEAKEKTPPPSKP